MRIDTQTKVFIGAIISYCFSMLFITMNSWESLIVALLFVMTMELRQIKYALGEKDE